MGAEVDLLLDVAIETGQRTLQQWRASSQLTPVGASEAVTVFQFDLPGEDLCDLLLFGFDHIHAEAAVLVDRL
nr:hypothetical protein [Pseudomonas sp. 2FE]